jgi:hypothetical protein
VRTSSRPCARCENPRLDLRRALGGALGIGAATALFSVVDAVVRRGLPLDEYDRLAAVLEYDPRRPVTFGGGATPQLFPDWRQQQQSFDGLAAVGSTT